ncbi:hypothetical protein B0H16DRAFT_1505240 [Mycena metata]|uniref:Uncharacterized protein n=1 Tax=Mycena metata TaxID=1033252 RepID=A0AAD7K5W5_9AGAR|nr:hypothetical protein B0H16DRAFT_1505240 [Mycena metata]
MVDVKFASLIRRLSLVPPAQRREERRLSSYASDILPVLLPRLQSLEWLDLHATQMDVTLLALVNSYPRLGTVGISDYNLDALRMLAASTSLSLSKIRVHQADINCTFTRQCSELDTLMSRGPRIAHLALRDGRNLKSGTLFLPGLEKLGISIPFRPVTSLSWLPAFVERHTSLQFIKFAASNRTWSQIPEIAFPLQFIDQLTRESLALAVDLDALSICRTASASSLDDWHVVALEISILGDAGISGLRIVSSITPHVSSLVVRMPLHGKFHLHFHDLISSLSIFPRLRRLELHRVSKNLVFEDQAPWVLLPPNLRPAAKTSKCIGAHSALLSIAAQVARVTALDFLHITDQGTDLELSENGKRFRHPWSLKATYEIQQNGDLEFHGTPQLNVANRYQRSAVAASRPIIYGRELRPVVLPMASAT